MANETCKQRIHKSYNGRISDLFRLWHIDNYDDSDPELGSLYEYGLGFDYVAPGTFARQRKGYFRYQLSWGGPADEFRFYHDGYMTITRIEYWFLDWGDGAKITLRLGGANYNLLAAIYDNFYACGWVEKAYQNAME